MFGVLTSEQSRQMAAGINWGSLQYLPVRLPHSLPWFSWFPSTGALMRCAVLLDFLRRTHLKHQWNFILFLLFHDTFVANLSFRTCACKKVKAKSYLHKYNIIENPKCSCNKGQQTVDHIIYNCSLQEQERERLKVVITRSEQWPVSKNKLVLKYYKNFKQFTDNIVLNKE
jgi:hypothetical protein